MKTDTVTEYLRRHHIAAINWEIRGLLKIQAVYGPNTIYCTMTSQRIQELRDERARLEGHIHD